MGVYRRGKILWICRKLANGRYIRRSTGTANKQVAQAINAKLEVQIAENKFLDVKRESQMGFSEFADLFFERYSKPNKLSWKTADQVYIKHLKRFFGSTPLSAVDQEMVERYRVERRASKKGSLKRDLPRYISPATVNRELACLRSLFTKAVEWGYIEASPCGRVKQLREPSHRTRHLNENEMTKLSEHASGELRQILTVLIHTGMRKGEIMGLKWNALDFDNGFITLTRTKSGKIRQIPMNATVKQVLLQCRIDKADASWVFPGRNGKPYDFRTAFETARRKAGLADVRVHDLRHTFASQLCMKGADIMTVRDLLGHSSLAMTERYAHLTNKHRQDAVQRLEGLSLNHVTAMTQSNQVAGADEFERVISREFPAS